MAVLPTCDLRFGQTFSAAFETGLDLNQVPARTTTATPETLLAQQQHNHEQCYRDGEAVGTRHFCHDRADGGSHSECDAHRSEHVRPPKRPGLRASGKSGEQAFDSVAKIAGRHDGAVAPSFHLWKACRLEGGDEGKAQSAGKSWQSVMQDR